MRRIKWPRAQARGFLVVAMALKSTGGPPQVTADVVAWALFAFQRMLVGNSVHAGPVRLVSGRGFSAVSVSCGGDREAVSREIN
jgi:hypothetical protein